MRISYKLVGNGKVGRQSSEWCFEVTGSECGVEKSRASETLDREIERHRVSYSFEESIEDRYQ